MSYHGLDFTYEDYQQNVLARASTSFHAETVDVEDVAEVLRQFVWWGNKLDHLKKSLMYGRAFPDTGLKPGTTGLLSTPNKRDQQIIHAILGFATEGVELVEALGEFFFADKPFDEINLQEEFGDGEWYRALGLDALGQSDHANRKQNDSKLETRYGPAFSAERANNRNLGEERRTLEG